MAFVFSLCTMTLARAAAGDPNAKLWVTFEADGKAHRVAVTSDNASRYLRRFVRGEAPVRVPGRVAEQWLRAAGLVSDQPTAGRPRPGDTLRVISAEECGDSGRCVRLRGLYAGRSP